MSRRAAAVVAALVTVCAGGCAGSVSPASLTPLCRSTSLLVLEAQSVPTAQQVPCIAQLPVGWQVGAVEARNDRTYFDLGSDRAGQMAVHVELRRTCETAGATEVTSDEPGTRRFERVESVTDGFRGVRYYTFPGGCVQVDLHLSQNGQDLLNDVSIALSFLPRSTLDAAVRDETHGRQRLDPPPAR